MIQVSRQTLSFALFCALCSCGGGGGGGGEDTGATGDGSSLTRGTNTALRVVHANVEASAVNVKVGDSVVQKARFAEEKFYKQINSGPVELKLEQLNGNTLSTIPTELAKNTEYTLLVARGNTSSSTSYQLLTDNMQRPAAGFHYVNVIHALNNSGALSASVGDANFTSLSPRSASNFLLVPSGEAVFVAHSADGGTVAQKTLVLEDGGETTLVISGDAEIGYVALREYKDLD